jgi:hypothetical protein
MGFFDDAGASLDPNKIADSVGIDLSGPATALSGAVDSVTGAIGSVTGALGGALGAIGGLLGGAAKPKLPMPNPLFAYASYTYSLSISVLTTEDYNNAAYIKGKKTAIICASAGKDPSNRVNTVYGKSDFYIDNLEINSIIGHERGNNSNATTFSFDITEPFSMGLFVTSLQQAAREAKHPNWHDAPFLLTMQFRGNTETGTIANIPGTTRYIPFVFTKLEARVTGNGAVYHCEAIPYNKVALNKQHSSLKSDVSVSGKTVQEMLQTGEKSLQAALNAKMQQLKKDGIVKDPDEYVILFPAEFASDNKPAGGTEEKSSATVATGQGATTEAYLSSLGVARNATTGLLEQQAAGCNAIGKAKMNFSVNNKGDVPFNKETDMVDDKGNIVRGKNVVRYNESDFRFSQNTDVFNAINQVILASLFPTKSLDPANITKEGYKGWWRIDTQVFIKPSDKNLASTGERPKIIVYRVIPYNVHASNVASINVQPPGIAELKKQAVKVYNYIYTGKNVDILKFNIEYNASFRQYINSEGFKRTQDAKTKDQESGSSETQATPKGVPDGKAPSTKDNVVPGSQVYGVTETGSDNKGGGGIDSEATRAARMFHDAVTRGTDHQLLNMDIIGDPYYIVQSGTGTYNSKPVTANLNADGSVAYQNGEVDIIVNFRSPSDINQATGLYNISKGNPDAKDTVVTGFSGLYRVTKLASHFKNGQFTQTIEGLRRRGQENPNKGTKDQMLNTKTPATESSKATVDENGKVTSASDPNKWGEG